MVTCSEVEYFDLFENEIVFWCKATNIPLDYIETLRETEQEHFIEDNFYISIGFNEYGFYMGEKYDLIYRTWQNEHVHWICSDVDEESFITMCRKEILKTLWEN